jgi:acetyltransferase
LGGVFVETLKDVQLLLPPVSSGEVKAALSRLRGSPLLAETDPAQLVDVVVRFSELCLDLRDEFSAIDLNPLIVRRNGRVVAVDALFERLHLSQTRNSPHPE